jgi:hypothetical protein
LHHPFFAKEGGLMDKQTAKAPKKKRSKKIDEKSEQASQPAKPELEGEGSYRATRAYDRDARDFVRSGQVGPAAADAKRAVENDEEAMRKAEETAKRGPEKLH